jgi:hypothetical protein
MVRAERFPRRGGSTLTGSFIELSTGPPTPQREESRRHHDRDHSRVGISCLSAVDLAEVLTDHPDGKQEPEPGDRADRHRLPRESHDPDQLLDCGNDGRDPAVSDPTRERVLD